MQRAVDSFKFNQVLKFITTTNIIGLVQITDYLYYDIRYRMLLVSLSLTVVATLEAWLPMFIALYSTVASICIQRIRLKEMVRGSE
jgi:hypothetical protein